MYNKFCVSEMHNFILVEDLIQYQGEILKRLKRRPC